MTAFHRVILRVVLVARGNTWKLGVVENLPFLHEVICHIHLSAILIFKAEVGSTLIGQFLDDLGPAIGAGLGDDVDL